MLYNAATVIESLLERAYALIRKSATLIIILTLLGAGVAAYYTSQHLRINTNTEDLLSSDLEWRINHLQYKKAFPQDSDTIVVVVDAATPDLAQDSAKLLAERLRRDTKLFREVYQIDQSPFFRKNQFLYLDVDELQDLSDNLAKVQPFFARLIRDQSLHGLLTSLTEAVKELIKGEDYALGPAFTEINKTLAAYLDGRRAPISWQDLMRGKDSTSKDRRSIFIVRPFVDFGELLPGEKPIEAIREIAKELHLTPDRGIRVRLTGGAALGYEELQSVSQGALLGTVASFALVFVILLVGFRSPWMVFASLTTLIVGLIYTAAFATITIGELNLISIGFAMLFIGLGIEYAIHFCLRYKELVSDGERGWPALIDTGKHVGAALVFSAFTSAIGFFAFMPTPYSGVADLGLIMGGGIFISAFLSLTLLPAMLSLMPPPKTGNPGRWHLPMKVLSLPNRYPTSITIIAGGLALCSLLILPRANFDYNPIHLQPANNESVKTYNDLVADSENSPLSIDIVTPDQETATKLVARLEKLKTVDDTLTIQSFIPADQEQKLAIIEEMSLVLGGNIAQPGSKQVSLYDQLTALSEFKNTLREFLQKLPQHPLHNIAERLFNNLVLLEQELQRSTDTASQTRHIAALEQDLISSLPNRLQLLQEGLSAESFTIADLPKELLERWRTPDGKYRIQVLPKENLDDNRALQRFVQDVRRVAPTATGDAIINVEASKAVITAFKQAFTYALIVITVLLAILMTRKIDVLFGLLPLILAGLLTGAVTILVGIPFNFANIITLPLIFGTCIDNSIHILHRYRTDLPADRNLYTTSAVQGVILSALTNIAGLGNLANSPHRGTASMGIMLTMGIIFALLTSLIVLPSLLELLARKNRTEQDLVDTDEYQTVGCEDGLPTGDPVQR